MSLDFFAGSAGVSYIVECSSNLKTWSTAGVTLSALDAGGYRTATVNMSDRECFLHLGAAY